MHVGDCQTCGVSYIVVIVFMVAGGLGLGSNAERVD